MKIGNNKWEELNKIPSYLDFALVGFGITTIPPSNVYLTEQIVIFGGWDGNEYNKRTLVTDKCKTL